MAVAFAFREVDVAALVVVPAGLSLAPRFALYTAVGSSDVDPDGDTISRHTITPTMMPTSVTSAMKPMTMSLRLPLAMDAIQARLPSSTLCVPAVF